MSGIPSNRTNINPPDEISQEILAKTQQASAIMTLARRVELPGVGKQIPVITSDPSAAWVGETNEKSVSNPGLSAKTMQAYKLAVIVPFSKEFRRDLRALYDELVRRIPAALGQQFDKTVAGAVAKPGENFDNFAACTAQSILTSGGNTAYKGLTAAYADIANHGGSLSGFAMSPAGIGLLLEAVDTAGRPIFTNGAVEGAPNRVLGQPIIESRGIYKAGSAAADSTPAVPAIVGIAGDWSQAMFGTVAGVEISISDQATLQSGTTTINLWQRNMFAVMAEIEVGFRADTACFNLLTGVAPSA